jgi:hypothetical protein
MDLRWTSIVVALALVAGSVAIPVRPHRAEPGRPSELACPGPRHPPHALKRLEAPRRDHRRTSQDLPLAVVPPGVAMSSSVHVAVIELAAARGGLGRRSAPNALARAPPDA